MDIKQNWSAEAAKDSEVVAKEYTKHRGANPLDSAARAPFLVLESDAYRLHKFDDTVGDDACSIQNSPPNELAEGQGDQVQERTNDSSSIQVSTLQKDLRVDKQFYGAYIQGLTRFLKQKLNSFEPLLSFAPNDDHDQLQKIQQVLSCKETSCAEIRKLLEHPGSKRQFQKKTLVPMSMSEQQGFRLERKVEYDHPRPVRANNFEKGHSRISKKVLKRKYKGPLYAEAGKVCIELTQKYTNIEDMKMFSRLTDMKYCLADVQNPKSGT